MSDPADLIAPAVYRWKGHDRDAVFRSGQTTEPPSDLAKKMYDRGWRDLRIHNAAGEEVGAIDEEAVGYRIWWAES